MAFIGKFIKKVVPWKKEEEKEKNPPKK